MDTCLNSMSVALTGILYVLGMILGYPLLSKAICFCPSRYVLLTSNDEKVYLLQPFPVCQDPEVCLGWVPTNRDGSERVQLITQNKNERIRFI